MGFAAVCSVVTDSAVNHDLARSGQKKLLEKTTKKEASSEECLIMSLDQHMWFRSGFPLILQGSPLGTAYSSTNRSHRSDPEGEITLES